MAPLVAAGFSPLLQWRSGVYIASGFAGILAMALVLVQAMLATGTLPLDQSPARRIHRITGVLLVLCVVGHVAGLWITSPPDVIDALTFTSPTPFSVWGVIAMWAVFGAALLALLRKRLGLRPITWRWAHATLALVVAGGTIVHALRIDGTMEHMTKYALSALVAAAAIGVAWHVRPRRR